LYIPEYHRVEDPAVVLAFMTAHPFAVLVSTSGGVPFATHIPMLVRERGGKTVIIGHMAKANPQWKLLQQEPESLAIFHGPHAYISPSLYEDPESVPTWNYAAVHAYGRATVFSETERLKEILIETIRAFDAAYFERWPALPEEYRGRMLNHIIGFEIVVERLEGKFKLSQNRSRRDRANVIDSLQQRQDSASAAIAKLMKEQGPDL
jgi:transcriptional regulator